MEEISNTPALIKIDKGAVTENGYSKIFHGVFGHRAAMPLDKIENDILKKSFDILFSGIVICTLLIWMIPLLALLIKLTSKGPIFYKQTRQGLHNKPFVCLKLRSMYLDNPEESKAAVRNDPRITPAGKILRKLSLDELPQFFNVIKGDMSVVGPRPLMISHTEEYSKVIDSYMIRHFVKPGITGLSQVEGYRGEISNKQILQNRVRLDLFYLLKWNFALDMNIIFKSIKLVFLGDKNAY